jgi:hypothetical protein
METTLMSLLNQDPEHPTAELDFGLPLGPVAEWSSFDREIATCAAIAYLVEPHNEIRRAGIRAEMLGNYFLRLERRQASSKSKKRRLRIEMLESFLEQQWRLLIPRAPPSSHVAAISFDLNNPEKKARSDKTSRAFLSRGGGYQKPFGRESRDLIRCGTIVRAMDFAHRHGDGALLTLDEAKTLVSQQAGSFSFGAALSLEREVLDDAWTRKRAVGHLAAALLSFAEAECQVTNEVDLDSSTSRLGTQVMPKFGIPNRHQLQRQIVRFFGYAQHYRELLVKTRTGRETSRYPIDFFGFPSRLELAAQAPDVANLVPERLVRPLSEACAAARNASERRPQKKDAGMSMNPLGNGSVPEMEAGKVRPPLS